MRFQPTPTTDSAALRICYSAAGELAHFFSSETVLIGRDPSCDLVFDDPRVHPEHAEIYRVGELWWVRDLGTSNGTYLAEDCIEVAPITGAAVLQLGFDGPVLWLQAKVDAAVRPLAGAA